jgi:hypothetical protein
MKTKTPKPEKNKLTPADFGQGGTNPFKTGGGFIKNFGNFQSKRSFTGFRRGSR